MSGTSPIRYKNGPNWYTILAFMAIPSVFCIIGVYRFYRDSVLNFLIVFLLLGFILGIAVIIREFINRPIFIDIDDGYIYLIFKFKKGERIAWNGIKNIYYCDGKDIPILGRIANDGAIVSADFPNGVLISCEIALKLREKYHLIIGNYLPIGSE